MKSVLGKLIQTEFGKEQYNEYAQKVDDKQGMDIFCDIYGRLSLRSREDLNEALKNLLTSVQESIWISKNFIKVTLGGYSGGIGPFMFRTESGVFIWCPDCDRGGVWF